MKLQDGFYWIKLVPNDNWIVARYSEETEYFYLTGVEETWMAAELHRINEERILPPQN